MRGAKICLFLLICGASLSAAAGLPFGTVFKGRDQFDRLVGKARSENWKALPIGERTATVGQALVGTRYKHFTLEIDNRVKARKRKHGERREPYALSARDEVRGFG